MRKVAYIFSFGHSGSTLLSLILEQHKQTVSIGEFASVSTYLPKLPKEKKCSCGEIIKDCPLWGDIYNACKEGSQLNLKEEYQLLLDSVDKNFTEDTVIVDSSKVMNQLQQLEKFDDVDLRVIYLIKDIRSYLVSTKRKALKRGQKFGFLDSLKNALIWYRDNRYNLNYLEQNKVKHLKIGYEELCLYPQETNEMLFDFLDIEKTSSSISIDNSQGHMIFGNRMRKDSRKNATIKYDNVWFTDTLVNIIGVLMPKVATFNRKVTYSNKFDQIWKNKRSSS